MCPCAAGMAERRSGVCCTSCTERTGRSPCPNTRDGCTWTKLNLVELMLLIILIVTTKRLSSTAVDFGRIYDLNLHLLVDV